MPLFFLSLCPVRCVGNYFFLELFFFHIIIEFLCFFLPFFETWLQFAWANFQEKISYNLFLSKSNHFIWPIALEHLTFASFLHQKSKDCYNYFQDFDTNFHTLSFSQLSDSYDFDILALTWSNFVELPSTLLFFHLFSPEEFKCSNFDLLITASKMITPSIILSLACFILQELWSFYLFFPELLV